MSYDPVDRLRKGNVDFFFDITAYDSGNLAERIRKLPDRLEVVKAFLPKLINNYPNFCFTIIYDMDEYENETIMLMKKHNFIKLNSSQIKNMLNNSIYGEGYIHDNLDNILSEDSENRMAMIVEFVYNKSKNKAGWIIKLSRNMNLHCRALFILYIIKNYPNELTKIYDDLPKYMTDYTGLSGEQISFFHNKISSSDMSQIVYACLESPLDRSIFLQLKEYLLANYEENDLAEFMLLDQKVKLSGSSYTFRENKLGVNEFKSDSDRLFTTSKNCQYFILNKYSEVISKQLLNELIYYVNLFNTNDDWMWSPLYDTFAYGLGKELKRCVDLYYGSSKDKTIEHMQGSTSHCFRLGDYIIKLVKTKWSYEDVICPSQLFPIIKNLEERYIRGHDGVVIAGLEVQKYLKKSAKGLPHECFSQLLNDLNSLGYYLTDTLMGGTCGDNCRILDSYKDADCLNPETLPAHFKKLPLVLIDRDRVYSLDNRRPKQLRESMS